MREIFSLNTKWAFSQETTTVPQTMPTNWYWVNLPHTWNAIDGQDGGGDYYRGTAFYAKQLDKMDLPKADRYFLEINGANSSAIVYVNGQEMARHDGGYSTWRVDVTDVLQAQNLIVIAVDNAPNDHVYPQFADFTFYGGLYRNVNMVCVNNSHFDLEYYGGPGIQITPVMDGDNTNVEVKVWTKNQKKSQQLVYTLKDKEGNVVATTTTSEATANFVIENAHRWHGRKDPYLYTAEVILTEGNAVLDNVSARFGCRTYEIDPERGFILNGEAYPLHGVSRHQDRWGIGNALLPEHHKEDMELICEMGANTIRLAHYQHDQYFYDLCDEYGQVVWAEIPYISHHLPNGRENTISQMKELIIQNYNHASIVVWGLSNEITMDGGKDPGLVENHRILNDMVHEMDKTRLTTVAALSSCSKDAAYLRIPDVISYNHYFGWYAGETDMNGPWFDDFHAAYPNLPVGMSEYGCEGLNWHSSNPEQGDYTEEYQSYYHEELIKQLFSRKYLWATHVWNMFDFGCDNRNEGGENGQNHKGLVTFDRKYKKDAFYAYKAWLSDDPFVHLCSKRYIDRVEDVTRVTVYSNQPEVELFANGVSLGKQSCPEHFFYFDVPNAGETKLTAVAGDYTDESFIRKVEEPNPAYRMVDKSAVLNWFDIVEPEGYHSLNSKVGDVLKCPGGQEAFMGVLATVMPKTEEFKKAASAIGPELFDTLASIAILRLINLMAMSGVKPTKEQLLTANAILNKVAKV